MRSVVVLPAPFGPRKPTISPSPTVRSTPRTASTVRLRLLNVRASPRASIIAIVVSASVQDQCGGRACRSQVISRISRLRLGEGRLGDRLLVRGLRLGRQGVGYLVGQRRRGAAELRAER